MYTKEQLQDVTETSLDNYNNFDYIIENRATVRATAKAFDISKSTVHKDVAERLKKFNPSLAEEAKKVRLKAEEKYFKDKRR